MDPTTMKALIQHVPDQLKARVGPYVTQLTRDQVSAISGLQSRLALVSESQVGEYLQPGTPELDLYRALQGGNEVACFSLNASRYGKLSTPSSPR